MLNFLTGLYEHIPTFMTSYVERVMYIILEASGIRDEPLDLVERREVIMQTVTHCVPTETCVESLSGCWPKVHHKRKV
jgi:hypothetical protein